MRKPSLAKLIKKQSALLKKELEGDIDHKLKRKILSQQSEIQSLRQAIEQLKTDNDDVIMKKYFIKKFPFKFIADFAFESQICRVV